MKTKLQIKSVFGSVLFEHECENNTIKETLRVAYLSGANLRGADLRGANLSVANLSGANLSGANLRVADLRGANLSDANLSGANLSDANLSGANLSVANLRVADLSGANLSVAYLSGANLSVAYLSGADLSDANLSDANLSGANLSEIKIDFFGRLLCLKAEVPALRKSIIEGKINGSSYSGECSCFMGTIATACKKEYTQLYIRPDANSPTERWFLGIDIGDTPEKSQIAKITVEWIDEFLTLIK